MFVLLESASRLRCSMLFRNRLNNVICVLAVVVVLLGCSETTDVPEIHELHPAQVTVDVTASGTDVTEAGVVQLGESNDLKGVASAETDLQEKAAEKAVAYDPPFPERIDLFKVPRREGRDIGSSRAGVEQAVELLGFVNVGSPQVVLSIDGIVIPLEEGSQIAEIEVVSIQPPAVVLQRGRQRWRAALGN